MTGVEQALGTRPRGLNVALPRLLGDERLARLAAAGDERAFAAIYRRYAGDLQRYCRAIVGNPDDAADAVQNTLVSALRALPGERREIALKPWLFRVAHNESVSLLRRRRPTVELDPERLTAADASERAETTDRLRRLVSDLRALPERQRAALVMRELSGLEFAEIAATLDTSPGAARQAVYEARRALQRMAEGREMGCDRIREAISARDRRLLRGRGVRAHLRACQRCSDFEAAIGERRRDLAQLAPPVAAPALLGLLKSLAGAAGGGSSGAAGAGGLTGAGSAGGVAGALGGSAAVKTAAAAVAAATLGAGAAGVAGTVDLPLVGERGPEARPATVSPVPAAARAPGRATKPAAATRSAGPPGRAAERRGTGARPGPGAPARDRGRHADRAHPAPGGGPAGGVPASAGSQGLGPAAAPGAAQGSASPPPRPARPEQAGGGSPPAAAPLGQTSSRPGQSPGRDSSALGPAGAGRPADAPGRN